MMLRYVGVLLVTVPFSFAPAPAKRALGPADEKIVRNSVYGKQAFMRSIPMQNMDELILPDDLVKVYKAQPKGTILVLLTIIEGGNPDESALAAAYAIALLTHTPTGLVVYKFYDPKTYDDVDEDWEVTPRQHWLKKVRQALAKKW